MLHPLQEAAQRGVPIVTFNPLRERGLERFTNPQSPVEMLTGSSTQISTQYHQVKAGGDLAALAKDAGRPVDKLGPIARDYKGDALPPEVVRTLFAVKPNGVATGATDDGYVVAQVVDVVATDPAKHPDGVEAVRADLASKMSQDILRQYQNALEQRFEVKVNTKAADAAIGAPQN
jgi:hypothetical protein